MIAELDSRINRLGNMDAETCLGFAETGTVCKNANKLARPSLFGRSFHSPF
jgi:hypothetical protein